MTALLQKTTKAVLWSIVDIFMRQGLQFIVVIVLARILTPADFGVIAMLGIFVAVAGVFIDSGFSSALIQRQNTTHTDESTVYFFNLGMGAVVVLMLCIIAPWIATFFKEPVLQNLTYVMAFSSLIGTLGSIHSTLLNKELNFKVTAKVGVIATLSSGSLAIVLAYQGFGVWSLALQGVVASVVTVVLLWFWHPWRPLWIFSFASLRTLFKFGGYLTVMNLVSVLHTNLYSVLIGKFYSVHDVGIYDRAQKTQMMSGNLIISIINRVSFPVFSSVAKDKERLARGFRKAQRLVMYANIPLMLGVIVLADPIVRVLFGVQWLACVPILRILGVVGLLLPMQIFNVNILMAQGRSDLLFKIMLLKRSVAIGLTIAASFYGILAIAWAQVLASLFALWVNAHYTDVFLNYGIRKQLSDLIPYMSAGVLSGLGMWAVTFADLPYYLELVLAAGLGAGLYLLASHLLHVDAHTEILDLIRKRNQSSLATVDEL